MPRALARLVLLVPLLLAAEPHDHHQHGNLERYIAELEDPARDDWQEPVRVVETLRVRPGMVVADVGAGSGYFTRRFAAAVGPTGRVIAVDTEQGMLDELRRRTGDAPNVERRQVAPDDPGLDPASVDLIFICNTGHHLPDRPRYYAKLREALRPGGRLVLVDFHKRPLPVGPPVERKLSQTETEAEAKAAGFRLRTAHGFLRYQYFLELEPAAAGG